MKQLVLRLALCALSSCRSTIVQPAQAWVEADRATFEAVAPAVEGWVAADLARPLADRSSTPPTDSEPAGHPRSDLELQGFLDLLAAWDFRLRQGEAAYEVED